MIFRLFIATLIVAFSCCAAAAKIEPITGKDPSLHYDWQSNLRWAVDFSSRGVFNDHDSFSANVVGFDLHKVFSTADRDIATLIFQPYLLNFSGRNTKPFFFDDRDTELTWRIANINFMALASGRLNIRLGHFEVPFGLEQNIDTNGMLRQYSFSERGIKADWGVSINGTLPQWDYEISLSRGSGNDITDRDNPYIFAGRVGSPAQKDFVAGLSFFDAKVLGTTGTSRRQRLGLDLAWYRKNWELLAELSTGENTDTETNFALLEASWRNNQESLHIYTQFKQQRLELTSGHYSGSAIIVGANQYFPNNFSISGQWSKPIKRFGSHKKSSEFTLQLRCRL